jgi:beta-phosphoglucomutase-like phosphatase (HAD superfamily)
MDFATYYGQSDRVFWLDFIAKHRPPQSLDELLSLKLGRLIDILRREQPLFAGLPDLIEKLAPRYRLAIAPGSKHPVIDEVLGMKQLRRFFSVVVSVQEVACGKPAPDVCLRAAERLSVPAGRCCVLEDSAAGMEVVAITNTLPAERLETASYVVDTHEEIEALLLEPEVL